MSRALDALVGGWQINAIFRAQSGNAFDVRYNNRLANVTGDPYASTGTSNQFLNNAAFSNPGTGLGNLERNSLRSPSTYQLNFGLAKDFHFTDRAKIQFRAEAFNLLNNIQWNTPDTNPNSGSFGRINSIAPSSNRQLQFGLRLEF
jgi:hypothetical protein